MRNVYKIFVENMKGIGYLKTQCKCGNTFETSVVDTGYASVDGVHQAQGLAVGSS